ncbi:MAG: hypothetical protein Q4C72_05930, partial [Eubacteriales bacterium]|nr:hypothetical protein [Eubacteriales bacterium]
MKKVTMFFAVALICTVFSFAAEESAPQAELQMQAPVLSEQTEAAEIAVSETLEQADAPAAPSELPVDDAMLVTPEIPAEDTAAAPEEQLP